MTQALADLKSQVHHHARGNGQLVNTILKEFLHQHILASIQRSPLAQKLVFQGGTALRLCYRNVRYSEDLDFVMRQHDGHRAQLKTPDVEAFKVLLIELLHKGFGLEVDFKDSKRHPEEARREDEVAVFRWVAKIHLKDLLDTGRLQKIHIEVADVPAYDPRPRVIHDPYGLPGSPGPVVLNVSSEREILTDKLVAVAARKFIKPRDIWDIKWLKDKNISPHPEWLANKVDDYHLEGMNWLTERLRKRSQEMMEAPFQKKFNEEMTRFLDRNQAETWLRDESMRQALLNDVSDYLTKR